MENNYIIPNIGSSGKFKFLAPFDNETYENQELTVTSIRSIKELKDNGMDVFKLIYQVVGLTENDFIQDFTNTVPIIFLTASTGNYIHIPANRITSLPDTSGIKYQERVLAINLGLLPLNYNLELTADVIKDSVYDTLGVESTVQEIKTSGVVLIDDDKNKEYLKLLANKKTVNLSYRTQYEKLSIQYKKLRELYDNLEKYVLALKGGTV